MRAREFKEVSVSSPNVGAAAFIDDVNGEDVVTVFATTGSGKDRGSAQIIARFRRVDKSFVFENISDEEATKWLYLPR